MTRGAPQCGVPPAPIVDALALAPAAVKEHMDRETALTAFVTKRNYDDALVTWDEVIKGTAAPPLIFANRTLHTRPSSLAA